MRKGWTHKSLGQSGEPRNPHKHTELIFDQGVKAIGGLAVAKAIYGVKIVSLANSARRTGHAYAKKKKKSRPKPYILHES